MKSERRAFTLLELMVAVGIIMVLVVILTVTLRRVRGKAQQLACTDNLRKIFAVADAYANLHNLTYPAGYVDANTHWMDLIEGQINKGSKLYRCAADRQQLAVTDDPDGMILSYGINRFSFAVTAPHEAEDYTFWNGVKKSHILRPADTIIFADCKTSLYYCGDPGPSAVFAEPVMDVAYRHLDSTFCAVFCNGSARPLGATTEEQWAASQ